MHRVGAVVELGNGFTVPFGQLIGLIRPRFHTVPRGLSQLLVELVAVRLDPQPVLLGHRGGSLLRLFPLVGVAPAFLGLALVLGVPVLAEDFALFLRGKFFVHGLRLHHLIHCADHLLQVIDAFGQQRALPLEVGGPVHGRIVQNLAHLGQRKPQLPVDEHAVDPRDVVRRIQAISRARAAAGAHQAHMVPVMQRPHAHADQRRRRSNRQQLVSRWIFGHLGSVRHGFSISHNPYCSP